ncbi:hypothetical protein [Micromonospora sp. NPDC005203]|uniref:hypothetical protein n=1 Tax=Micromonospora sp. NPDC005203 TaxID=3364226 RepID=UPI0036D04C73
MPLGEEKLGGVDKVIDAVGFQARDGTLADAPELYRRRRDDGVIKAVLRPG